jgi:tRNA threonylcarbamoyladenosine modification (KEOPS) complex  Pcc1 subunit
MAPRCAGFHAALDSTLRWIPRCAGFHAALDSTLRWISDLRFEIED